MSRSFVKTPSCLLFNPAISPLELRLLMALIFWNGINTEKENHVKYGAQKLGKQIGIGRESCRKALYKLEKLKLITIKHRGNIANESYGISNDIELTIDAGIEFLQSGSFAEKGYLPKNEAGNLPLNSVGNLPLNSVGNLPLKKPDLPLNWADLHLNEAGHIDDRFKININLNKISRTRVRTHSEPADVASGRSMPTEGLAKEGLVEGSQLDIEDLCLWQAFKEVFPKRYPWFQLIRVGKQIGLRGVGKMGDSLLDNAWKEVFDWFKLRGVAVEKIDLNTRFNNEIIIKEAV